MTALPSSVPAFTFARPTRRAGPDLPDLPLTSLIDVVFLLLIFFLCSQLTTFEGELLAQLGEEAGLVPGARVVPDRRPETVRVYVAREPDGSARYVLNGAPLAAPDRLFPALAALKARHPDLEAVLDGDDRLDFKHFLFALNECLRAGVGHANFVRAKARPPEG